MKTVASVTSSISESGGTARLDDLPAFIRSLVSCSLVRAAQYLPSGAAAATTTTLLQLVYH
jgi:hypothetical protein